MKNKLNLSPKSNPKVDPVYVKEIRAGYNKSSIKESIAQKIPSNSTVECNTLTSQILAKLADVKEKLYTNSKVLEMSPSPKLETAKNKENSPKESDESSSDDEYTLNTGRLRQFSLKAQRNSEKTEGTKELRKTTIGTLSPKEKEREIREEIMKSNSKIKHYYYKKY